MKKFMFVLLGTMCAASVAHAAGAEFQPSTYTTYKTLPPHSGEVQVLDRLPPVGEYIEIGTVRVGSKEVYSNGQCISGLKEKTAQHGGNAIVLLEDAKLLFDGRSTPRGTRPLNATAVAIVTPSIR